MSLLCIFKHGVIARKAMTFPTAAKEEPKVKYICDEALIKLAVILSGGERISVMRNYKDQREVTKLDIVMKVAALTQAAQKLNETKAILLKNKQASRLWFALLFRKEKSPTASEQFVDAVLEFVEKEIARLALIGEALSLQDTVSSDHELVKRLSSSRYSSASSTSVSDSHDDDIKREGSSRSVVSSTSVSDSEDQKDADLPSEQLQEQTNVATPAVRAKLLFSTDDLLFGARTLRSTPPPVARVALKTCIAVHQVVPFCAGDLLAQSKILKKSKLMEIGAAQVSAAVQKSSMPFSAGDLVAQGKNLKKVKVAEVVVEQEIVTAPTASGDRDMECVFQALIKQTTTLVKTEDGPSWETE